MGDPGLPEVRQGVRGEKSGVRKDEGREKAGRVRRIVKAERSGKRPGESVDSSEETACGRGARIDCERAAVCNTVGGAFAGHREATGREGEGGDLPFHTVPPYHRIDRETSGRDEDAKSSVSWRRRTLLFSRDP